MKRLSQNARVLDVLPARMAAKIEICADGCWYWTAGRDLNGYGRYCIARRENGRGGKDVKAHRAVYEIVHGPVPTGLELDHLCRNTGCVNPDHLEPVTHAENIRRGYAVKPRAKKSHCRNGHAYEGNSFTDKNGVTRCTECARASTRRYRDRNREAVRAQDREAKRRQSDLLGIPERWPGRVHPIYQEQA